MTDTTAPTASSAVVSARQESAEFEERVLPLLPALLAYFQRRVEPREEAADCLSETLIVLWRQRSRLPEGGDALRAYSFGVAHKVLDNQRRGRLRRINLNDRLRRHFTPTIVDPAAADEAASLLAALTIRDRELVTLVVLDGFGVAEAGAIVGLRPGAARTRYARARARLRQHLETART